MLSVFPELFAYELIGILILRIAVAIIVIKYSFPKVFKTSDNLNRVIGAVQGLSGICLLIGFLTQVSSLLIIITLLIEKIRDVIKKEQKNNCELKLLILVICLALLFLGPGTFSIDLPL